MRHPTLLAALGGVVVGAAVVLSLPAGTTPEPPPAPPLGDKVPATTFLAWTPSELPEAYGARAAAIDGVERVAVVRSGTAWLGAPDDDLRVPIEVAAVDPATYAGFVPPADAPAFGRLTEGGLLLGRSAARLRGDPDLLRFGDVDIPVLGVVDDALIGAHEAVVSVSTGERLGVTRRRYVLVASSPDASVREQLYVIAPEGVRVRVRAPGETPEFRHGDAVLAPVRLKELFGEFAAAPTGRGNLRLDPAWVREHIVAERVPALGEVRCHRRVMPQIRAALQEIADRGLAGLIDTSDFGGCFFPRFLSQDPGAGISHHSWGVAFDLNVSENPFGREPRIDPRVVEVLERWGFTWGGRWLVPDGMHFEFLRFPLSPKG